MAALNAKLGVIYLVLRFIYSFSFCSFSFARALLLPPSISLTGLVDLLSLHQIFISPWQIEVGFRFYLFRVFPFLSALVFFLLGRCLRRVIKLLKSDCPFKSFFPLAYTSGFKAWYAG